MKIYFFFPFARENQHQNSLCEFRKHSKIVKWRKKRNIAKKSQIFNFFSISFGCAFVFLLFEPTTFCRKQKCACLHEEWKQHKLRMRRENVLNVYVSWYHKQVKQKRCLEVKQENLHKQAEKKVSKFFVLSQTVDFILFICRLLFPINK